MKFFGYFSIAIGIISLILYFREMRNGGNNETEVLINPETQLPYE